MELKDPNCLPGIVLQLSETGYNTEGPSFIGATVLSKLKRELEFKDPNCLPGIVIQLSETGYNAEDPYFLGATILSKLMR